MRAWVSWSTGKDSAYALEVTQREGLANVVGLFSTVIDEEDVIAYHRVPVALAQAQADTLGLPLHLLRVPLNCSAAEREVLRQRVLVNVAVSDRVGAVVFGDMRFAEIRKGRRERLAAVGMRALFPLWGRDTGTTAREMIGEGVRAIVARVGLAVVNQEHLGRPFDLAFLDAIGPNVDPCGENGEFDTFVQDAPSFASPVTTLFCGASRTEQSAYARLQPVPRRPR